MMKKFIALCAALALLIPILASAEIGKITFEKLFALNPNSSPPQMILSSANMSTVSSLLKTNIPQGSGTFTAIPDFSFAKNNSTNQDLAFVGTGTQNQSGIYYLHNGTMQIIVNQKTEIPNGSGFFTSLHNLCLNQNGQISFIGTGILGQQGLYVYDDGKLKHAVDQRSIVPGQNALFDNFYHASCNKDLIVFSADDQSQMTGIYAYVFAGKLLPIINQNEKINKQSIQQISLPKNALQGQKLYFQAILVNNQKVTYMATLSYLPF